MMNEYINLTEENIDNEHICCAIGDPKHQQGVDSKKKWIRSKLKDGKVDTLEKAKINNWANFYRGEFVSNTILNANSFEKLIK